MPHLRHQGERPSTGELTWHRRANLWGLPGRAQLLQGARSVGNSQARRAGVVAEEQNAPTTWSNVARCCVMASMRRSVRARVSWSVPDAILAPHPEDDDLVIAAWCGTTMDAQLLASNTVPPRWNRFETAPVRVDLPPFGYAVPPDALCLASSQRPREYATGPWPGSYRSGTTPAT
jgi:hypothetical protein